MIALGQGTNSPIIDLEVILDQLPLKLIKHHPEGIFKNWLKKTVSGGIPVTFNAFFDTVGCHNFLIIGYEDKNFQCVNAKFRDKRAAVEVMSWQELNKHALWGHPNLGPEVSSFGITFELAK